MTITQDQAEAIQQQHNVYVDVDSGMYTHGERDDDYGWEPIPQEWLNDSSGLPSATMKERGLPKC